MTQEPLGAVLTGGRSSRFGSPKALVELQGRALSVRVADALRAAGCAPVIAVGEPVGAPPGALGRVWAAADLGDPARGVPVADAWPGEGPLGAVLTALGVLGTAPGVLTAACDLAWLDPAAVRRVLPEDAGRTARTGAVVRHAVSGGDLVPLIWWPREVGGRVAELFAAGERSLRAAMLALDAEQVEVDAAAGRDVDLPGDLSAAEDLRS